MPVTGAAQRATGATPLVVADVGGTHVRLALAHPGDRPGAVELSDYRRYDGADHPALAAIVRGYLRDAGVDGAAEAVIATAGLLRGDALLHANLPWPVSVEATRRESGLRRLELVNDFEALAWALPTVDPAQALQVCGPADAAMRGPILAIGPGTGLGAAMWYPGPPETVIASEAGHAALAAGDARELELVGALLRRWPHVANERVLSGPGLVNAYAALCAMAGIAPRLTTPTAVTAAAADGGDAQAVEALRLFCAMLGSLAGDLAIGFGAGSVYLAGGIPARISDFLLGSEFAARFRNKGVMGDVLAQVPVRVVEHGRLALLGAALRHWRRRAPATTEEDEGR